MWLVSLGVFLLFGNVFLRYTFLECWGYTGFDFYLFYDAAVDLSEGKSPYENNIRDAQSATEENHIWVHYIYPPFFARLLYPLTFFSMPIARKIYLAICTFLYFYLLLPRRWIGGTRWISALLAVALLLIWQPAILTFRWAQSNYAVLFLFYAAWKLLEPSRAPSVESRGKGTEVLAGFSLGLAAMVKLTPVVLIPLFVAAGQLRLTIGFLLGFVAALFISGLGVSFEYFTEVLPTLGGIVERRDCPSLHIAVIRGVDWLAARGWTGEETVRFAPILGLSVNASVYSTVLFCIFRRRETLPLGGLILLGCFFPPLLAARYPHHYLIVILPILFVVRRLVETSFETPNESVQPCADLATNKPCPWWKAGLSPIARLRFLLVALSPYYYYFFRYWLFDLPVLGEIVAAFPVTHDSAMAIGTLAALWLCFPVLIPEEVTRQTLPIRADSETTPPKS